MGGCNPPFLWTNDDCVGSSDAEEGKECGLNVVSQSCQQASNDSLNPHTEIGNSLASVMPPSIKLKYIQNHKIQAFRSIKTPQ